MSDRTAFAPSNRRFWIAMAPTVVLGALLLTLILASRPAAERASEFTARDNLRRAAEAARHVAEREGTFADAIPLVLESEAAADDLLFIDPDLASNDPDVVSVFATEELWAGAARADTGTCYWIRVTPNEEQAVGIGTDCSGEAAATARPDAWPSP
jgi:hypothetical protein